MNVKCFAALIALALGVGFGIGQVCEMRTVAAQVVVNAESFPEEIAFCNEARVDAEMLRAVRIRLGDRLATWYRLRAAFTQNTGVELDDGRAPEGISQLTTDDITNLYTQVEAVYAVLAPNAAQLVTGKPCVRSLRPNGMVQ